MSMLKPTIQPLTQFWLALERIPGQAAVTAQWQCEVKDDFARIFRFLSPEPRLATSYPRLQHWGMEYEVIDHGAEEYVGVCNDDGDAHPLSRADLIIYRLDLSKLSPVLTTTLGCTPEGNVVDGLNATYRIGTLRPSAGYAFPVFLTIQLEPSEFKAVIESLLVMDPNPFILLAPTNRHHRGISPYRLSERGCLFLALADAIHCDAHAWHLTESAQQALDGFTARQLPTEEKTHAFFPTPAGATWANLHIRFVDGHRVTVKVGHITQTLNYTQMGFADRRNGNPTKQWDLLQRFAAERGLLTWGSKGASHDQQKRKENLVQILKSFFRIPGEPICWDTTAHGWQTIFTIEPDA